MNLTEQEAQYVLQAVMQRPLAEALPLFLKMTGQKLVPVEGGGQGQETVRLSAVPVP